MPDTPLRSRRNLAASLRTMRAGTGLSGNQFAARLGWLQSRVSKLETGKQFPTENDIRAWGEAASAPPDALRDLLGQLERARVEYATHGENYRTAGNAAANQARYRELYESSAQITKFLPLMIPSEIQTAEYARELLRLPSGPPLWEATEDEIDAMLTARMQRQQILYDPGRQTKLLILEAALRVRLVSPEAMTGQLDRMLALAGGLPSLELGIVPSTVRLPVYPHSGFAIFDDSMVIVELIGGEHQDNDPAAVARYVRCFGLLHEVAVYGHEARHLIRRALDELGGEISAN